MRMRCTTRLTSGKLFAAGLDVFRDEPDFDLRFAGLDNVVLSPHVGSASKETRDAMGYRALDNIAAVLDWPAGHRFALEGLRCTFCW